MRACVCVSIICVFVTLIQNKNDVKVKRFPVLWEKWQKQMVQYLEETEQLSQFQCGFRKHHSTQDAVTYFTDWIRKGIDKGCFTGAVLVIDRMRKAFDSVDHLLLLEKLVKLGIVELNRDGFLTIWQIGSSQYYMRGRCLSLKKLDQEYRKGLFWNPSYSRYISMIYNSLFG